MVQSFLVQMITMPAILRGRAFKENVDMDDTISKKAALVAVKGALMAWSYMPEWRDEKILEAIAELPSAQKMGKWIYHIDDLFPAESTMECNQCHAEQPLTCDDEFCPHCGAKMEVTE